MRITTKFIGSSALLVMITTALAGGSYWMHRRAAAALAVGYEEAQDQVVTVLDIQEALREQTLALGRLSVIPEGSRETTNFNRARTEFIQALNELEATVSTNNQQAHLRISSIRQQHTYLDTLANRLQTEPTSAESIEEVARSLKLFEQTADIYVQALIEDAKEQAIAARKQARMLYQRGVQASLLSAGIVIMLLLAQYYWLLRPVLGSLRHLQQGADRLGSRTLASINAASDLEFGDSFGLEGTEPCEQELTTTDTARTIPKSSVIEVESLESLKIDLAQRHLESGNELQALAAAFNQMSDRLTYAYQELENRVAQRTAELELANYSLLQEVSDRKTAEADLSSALRRLQQAQVQLLQTEKMSSLSQLVAGVAHEINNPISFIQGNLAPAQAYVDSLMTILTAYQKEHLQPSPQLQAAIEEADLAFIEEDFPQLLESMSTGTRRVSNIVESLRTFSNLDESETKTSDLHKGIESALLLLASRLGRTESRPAIEVIRQYGDLPKVYCYPGQMNQVFMGLLTNAIDALASSSNPTLTIVTKEVRDHIQIQIQDNGAGMDQQVQEKIFDPFFTTKPVGSGMGLGLSMSYQIVTMNHKGTLSCVSTPGEGTTFTVIIPMELKLQKEPMVSLVDTDPKVSSAEQAAIA